MTDDDKKLVEHLRSDGENERQYVREARCTLAKELNDAADRIEALSVEIANLRQSLQATAEAAAAHLKTAIDRDAEIARLTGILASLNDTDVIAKMRLDNEWLREALVKAEHTFRWYGDMHAAKPDPDKAKRNYDLANEMRQALGEQP